MTEDEFADALSRLSSMPADSMDDLVAIDEARARYFELHNTATAILRDGKAKYPGFKDNLTPGRPLPWLLPLLFRLPSGVQEQVHFLFEHFPSEIDIPQPRLAFRLRRRSLREDGAQRDSYSDMSGVRLSWNAVTWLVRPCHHKLPYVDVRVFGFTPGKFGADRIRTYHIAESVIRATIPHL